MKNFIINLDDDFDLRIKNGPIAVVDDDPVQKELLKACHELSMSSIEVIFFMTGDDFIREITRCFESGEILPELILLDINMPGMNGFQVLEAIRSHKEMATSPLIVMHTASDAQEDIQKSKKLGANAFWTKPGRAKAYIDFFESVQSKPTTTSES